MANDPSDPKQTKSEAQLQREKKLLEELIKKTSELAEQADQLAKIQEKGGNAELTKQEALLKEIEIQDELIEKSKEIAEQKLKTKELTQEEYENELLLLETEKERYNITRQIADETNKFGKSAANSFSSMTGIGGQSKTLLGSMVQLAGKGGSFRDAMGEAGQQIGKSLTPANLLAASIDKIGDAIKAIIKLTIDFAIEQDKAYASFEKEAGNVSKYENQISQLRNENGRYGVSITDATNAFKAFKTEFAGFEGMSVSQQNTLAKTSAQLTKLGVAQTEVVKTQEMLIKGMGMSVKQSTDLQKSLYGTAIAMGLPPKQVAAEFNKAAPQLAAQGKNMTKVFLDLQNNAKNTGIEFNRLLDITKKFDTFEGAADSAGQLNAILGGDYLNSIQLLNADEGERVRLLQDSLKASGKSIEQMSKQEQQATAQALGLQDVTELQKLMNNETTKGTVEAMRAEEAQKQMNSAIEDATELGEAWKNLMMKLAVEMRPVIKALKEVVMGITGFVDQISVFLNQNPNLAKALGIGIVLFGLITAVVLGLIVGLIGLASAMTAATTVMGGIAVAGPVAAGGMSAAAGGIAAVGAAATASAVGLGILALVLLAAGASALMMGAGIAVAAAGIAFMIKSIADLIKSVGDLFNTLSKSDPANIAKTFDALFDSLSIARIAKFTAFATAADGLADSINNINKSLTEMILKMAIVDKLNFSTKVNATTQTPTGAAVSPKVSTATAAAANIAGNSPNSNSSTNIVPVAVYLDSKKIGEILDPRIKQTIQDSMKNIGSKTAAVGI